MVVVVPCLSVGPYRPEVTVCRRDLHVEGLRAELVRGRVDQPGNESFDKEEFF